MSDYFFFVFPRGYAAYLSLVVDVVAVVFFCNLYVLCLIVSFLLEPATRISAEVESSRFVIDEDCYHEGNSG